MVDQALIVTAARHNSPAHCTSPGTGDIARASGSRLQPPLHPPPQTPARLPKGQGSARFELVRVLAVAVAEKAVADFPDIAAAAAAAVAAAVAAASAAVAPAAAAEGVDAAAVAGILRIHPVGIPNLR